MDRRSVYMDFNATSPIRQEVQELLIKRMGLYANASSMHEAGRQAQTLVEEARKDIASLINAPSEGLIFSSGGSESNNTVFQTMLREGPRRGRKTILISAIEHPCVLNAAAELERQGFSLVLLPVDGSGRLNIDYYKRALGSDSLLVSVMMANNEVGTVQDIALLAELAHQAGALFHTDAVQAAGKIPVDVKELNVDYVTLSAHKIYGPKGVGALWRRKGSPLEPFIRGGHQEEGLRAGTYNTLGIYGFGLAAQLAKAELSDYTAHLSPLRKRLKDGLIERIPDIQINGDEGNTLPNTLNVSFSGAEGEAILLSLDLIGIACSTGSACASGSLDPSHVLMAMGLGPELAHGSIRFSLGRPTDKDDVDYVIEKVPPIIARLRAMSTLAKQERI